MKNILALIAINLFLIAGIAFAADALVVQQRDLRFDFYPHYVGGRTVWSGETPYTRQVTEQIQMGMFGELLPPEADQQNMAYPAYASVVLAPVIALPPHASIAVWMAIQFVAMLWTPILWVQILKWRPSPLLIAALILGVLFVFRYPIDTFVLGQFSGTVLFSISLGFLLLLQGRDVAAGLVFCLASVPPTMGVPLVLAILGAYLLKRRWRGLAAFLGGMLALILVSFALIGYWIPDYLRVVSAYQEYAEITWTPGVFNFLPLTVLFVLALVGLSLWVLRRFVTAPPEESTKRAVDLVITALIVSLLLIPLTGEYYLVLLIPAFVVILRRAAQRDNAAFRWLIYALVIIAIFSPWIFWGTGTLAAAGSLVPLLTLVTWGLVNLPPNSVIKGT